MFKRNKKNVLLLVLIAASFSVSPFAKAANIEGYTLEQGIPFIGGAGQTLGYGEFSTLFQKFITAVYIIAAIAAFIKIFLAGLKWYTSSGSAKAISQAREDIKNALMGLAFLFLAGTLLVFINPNLNKLSKVFNPNGGTQCVQGETSANGTGGAGNSTGTLSKIGTSGYYADRTLSDKLVSSGLNFRISTGCTNTNQLSCNPNYCLPAGCETQFTCAYSNPKGSDCEPLTYTPCHFNGSCVDLVPSGNYPDAIAKLYAAGLDILDESGDICGNKDDRTNDHLHVALPGNIASTGGCAHKHSFNPNP
jgi:hypothetical protein